ncbi:hypothetical protein P4O66_022690, partial [Electrophorus voltai]
MFTSKERDATGLVLSVLHKWDQGNKSARASMLQEFLTRNAGKTSMELELEFAQAGSLFLTRITAWMRLTLFSYMFGTYLELQLRALEVFLSAAGRYLMEFLEMGGVLTLLEVLGHSQITEKAKTLALHLLRIIANTGRKYKEIICESYGMVYVTACAEETQHTASVLLEALAHGNPRYQQQVYKGLVALLSCNCPKTQQLVLQTVRTVQVIVKTAHLSIVEPLLNLLRSLHLEVQYEAIELIKELQQTEVRPALLRALVTLLKPAREGVCKHKILQGATSLPPLKTSYQVFRMLAEEKQDISEELIHLGVIHHLLCAMGNLEHADTQRQASLALEHFVRSYPVVEEHVRTAMGPALFDCFMHNAELLYMSTDQVQADLLLANKVHILRAESARPSSYHFFNEPAEVSLFRSRLLRWYDQSKRDLPWRTVAMTETDANIRTYAVWVSEVMLQQTQVATVIDYYNKWMKASHLSCRWPTVQELAAASVEVIRSETESGKGPGLPPALTQQCLLFFWQDVNEMWAGLGYYSRGRRLHQGAQKVVVVMSELAGEMPRTTQGLLKWLPGVGRYTAGAVGSIALGLVTGAVDGNVTRVLCRLRAIGADCTSSLVTDLLWEICNLIVDPERPGQFNQALMELGALVCRPKSPLCARCPVQTHCHAYRKVILIQETDAKSPLSNPDSVQSPCVPDIEDCSGDSSCKMCLSEGWARDLGVQNYPRKPVRKAPRVERMVTCVLRCRMTEDEDEPQYLLIQRPSTGLLAGMWELPSILLEEDIPVKKHRALLSAEVQRIVGTSPDEDSFQYLGEVVHIFSHIHQTYVVYSASVGGSTERDREPQSRWVSASALQEAAVSTGVKKIMKLYYESTSKLQDT